MKNQDKKKSVKIKVFSQEKSLQWINGMTTKKKAHIESLNGEHVN